MPRINQQVKHVVSGAGAAVSVDFANPGVDQRLRVLRVDVSYSAAPAAGLLTIARDPGADEGGDEVTVWEHAIERAGLVHIPFGEQGLGGIPANNGVDITLAGGGGAVVGRITAIVFLEQ